MLSTSKIKPIILCTITPIIVYLFGSLITYNNNDSSVKFHYKKRPAVVLEVPEPVSLVTNKLPEIKIELREVKPSRLDQIKCMAHNIYYEAGGEPFMGQVAVARVVMNRVLHGFAANPCQVIYQTTKKYDNERERAIIHCQFSWVCQGKIGPDVNSQRYKTAESIAEQVIREDRWNDEIPNNVLYFHNKTVKPRWPHKHEFTIGNHLFYGK